MHAAVQHFAERVDDQRTHAAEALCERVGAQQQHGTRFGLAQRLTGTDSVALFLLWGVGPDYLRLGLPSAYVPWRVRAVRPLRDTLGVLYSLGPNPPACQP